MRAIFIFFCFRHSNLRFLFIFYVHDNQRIILPSDDTALEELAPLLRPLLVEFAVAVEAVVGAAAAAVNVEVVAGGISGSGG